MHIRTYQDDDRDAVLALAPRLTAGVASWRDPAAVHTAVTGWVHGSLDTHDPDRAPVLVADVDGEVVGFVTVCSQRHWTGEVDAYIGELAVARCAEGAGIGRQLVRAAEDWALEHGYTKVTLETGAANAPARGLYARLGYREEGVRLTHELTTSADHNSAGRTGAHPPGERGPGQRPTGQRPTT